MAPHAGDILSQINGIAYSDPKWQRLLCATSNAGPSKQDGLERKGLQGCLRQERGDGGKVWLGGWPEKVVHRHLQKVPENSAPKPKVGGAVSRRLRPPF